MKKIILPVLTVIVVSLIGCFGCNTGGKNMQSIISDGMELIIEQGEHWQGKMKIFIFSVKKTPQLAVWIENEQENYISTITATNKSVKNNWTSAPKEGRPEALPVWNHKRQNSAEQIDIVTSATPKGSIDIQIDNSSLTNGQEYNVYLEINHSFDYNDYWTENDSGVNGQPSLIYHAKITAGVAGKVRLTPIGHGSVDGSSGDIENGLDSFTTALAIIKEACVVVK
ncbi:MAG: DUF2271 domain-containing protein [Treponema sp.]|jgi:hypothetical protein|nr:DUF2271 domain-containing protein [Treponema sp.]